jgi:predicted permease
MKALRRFLKRLLSTATRRQNERRLTEEFEEHLALQTAEYLRSGLSPVEARRQALLKFGAVESFKEEYRDQQGLASLEILLGDTRHALRRLRHAPAFTITTVLTLALGIGATTSIFTLVHAVLLKSLPVTNPAELYRLGKVTTCCYQGGYSMDKEFSMVSYDLYKYLRDNTRGFAELAAVPSLVQLFGVRRSGNSEAAQSFPGEFVSGNYFTMFGIGAFAGRALTPQDDHLGAPPVAVMSYRLWQQRYGSDPSVIGGVFNLDNKPFTVVGITPPGFFGDTLRSTPPDFFLPLNSEPYIEVDADLDKYNTHWLDLIGRIQPGANPASIEAQMRVELKQWLRLHWGEMDANERAKFPEQTLFLTPGDAGITSMREQYQRWLQILMTVSGFVLLIVCANVANLMLVRGMERRRQISLSMALGARASRLVRQALTESILLSLSGGAAGLAIAFAGTRLILHFAFPSLPGSAGVPIDASPSLPVLLFAFITSLATGVAFGIAPAWMATRVDPIEALRGAGRSTVRTGSLPRKTLVVLQAALSLVLLSTSGLLTAALHRLENQDFGFDQDRRIVASVNPRLAGYRTDQLSPLYRRIRESIARVPGVSSVAICSYSPLSGGGWGTVVWVDGHPAPGPADNDFAAYDRVTAGYLDVIGTPIIRGRGILEQDTATSQKVAVINEAFARKFFKNEDPIGKHFGRDRGASREFEVVGITKDARYLTFKLDQPIVPFLYIAEAQAEYSAGNLGSLFLNDIVILPTPGAAAPVAQIRQAVASADPNLPIVSIRTLKEQVAGQFTQQRLIARLTSFFGILSLVLASIGLYGVTAYNAGRRVSEIGVRMALGAGRGDVFALILRGALALISFGLLLGIPLALGAGRFLESQLYGVNQYDPIVIATSILALGASALIAALIPAFRASSISPIDALRQD